MKKSSLVTVIAIAATFTLPLSARADDAPQVRVAAVGSPAVNDQMVIESAPRRVVGEMIVRQFGNSLIEQLTVKQVNADGSYTMNDQLGRIWAYNADGNMVKGYGRATGTAMIYSPYNPSFQFPMVPGQKWQKTVSWQGGGWQDSYTNYTLISGWEMISLTIQGQVQSVTALRMDYEVQERGSRTKTTCWFAPALKAMAKCESSNPAFTLAVIDYKIIGDERVEQSTSSKQ